MSNILAFNMRVVNDFNTFSAYIAVNDHLVGSKLSLKRGWETLKLKAPVYTSIACEFIDLLDSSCPSGVNLRDPIIIMENNATVVVLGVTAVVVVLSFIIYKQMAGSTSSDDKYGNNFFVLFMI